MRLGLTCASGVSGVIGVKEQKQKESRLQEAEQLRDEMMAVSIERLALLALKTSRNSEGSVEEKGAKKVSAEKKDDKQSNVDTNTDQNSNLISKLQRAQDILASTVYDKPRVAVEERGMTITFLRHWVQALHFHVDTEQIMGLTSYQIVGDSLPGKSQRMVNWPEVITPEMTLPWSCEQTEPITKQSLKKTHKKTHNKE